MKNELSFERVGENCLIINGDSIDVMKHMNKESIDLILTDPPYNIGKFMHERNTNMGKLRKNHFSAASWDNLTYQDWVSNMNIFFEDASKVLKVGGSLIIFMSLIKIETIKELAEKYGFYYKTTGIWHKTNPMPRNMNLHFVNSTEAWMYFTHKKKRGVFNNHGKVVHDFFETSNTPLNEKEYGDHPTQKPEVIVEKFVELLTNRGDSVLDPFMGSGTTGKACQTLGRKFFGIEISSEYYQIAKERLSNNQTRLVAGALPYPCVSL